MAAQSTTIAEPMTPISKPQEQAGQKPKRQPPYHVILWNDESHTFDYVIGMMMELFGHTLEKGVQIAKEVDTQGRAIVLTTTMEHAELKRDQNSRLRQGRPDFRLQRLDVGDDRAGGMKWRGWVCDDMDKFL